MNLLEPQTNYGASEWIRVSGGPEFGGHVDVGLVDFAEAETPEPDALRRAVLRLHYQNCSGERVEVRRLPVRWDEARVNHDCADDLTVPLGAPGCGEGVEWPIDGPEGPFNTLPLVAEAICPAGTGELAIDVTADVLSWGTGERWGWAIGSERGAFRFASDDHLTLAPSLTMTTETDWVPEEPVAPQLDHTAITNVRDAYRFLYDPAAVSGDPQNVQLGVFPGTIDADRAAHLRGQVLRDDGSPLGGVSITVRGHPEVGRTRSRAGGVFDLVLNGGGPVTLIYRHPDHLEVHRTVYAGWNDDLAVADVVMTPNPTRCSPYVSGAAGGMLTGTEVILSGAWSADGQNGWSTEDGRGARAFGLYIPPQVAPINEGGAVGGYRICMTEYTRDVVGTDRENAMPADIATNTAYTFAAEGQIVQVADASDSTGQVLARAEFSDDAYLYVRTSDWHGGGEDLRFVAGTVIPMGNFDRDLSAWVPARDGVAIDVLCSNGLFVAMLPATAGELTVHEQVAICGSSLVDSDGQTWTHLWRVPVRHFSPVDLNVCTITEDIPPPGSGGPEESNGGHGDESEHCEPGSIIHCEGRSVAETIPLAGVGASLVYQSSHHLGRQDLRELRVRPVRQPVSIPSLGATSRVFVSGRQIAEFAFSNADLAAGVSRSVTWDGLDGFGRRVNGPVSAEVVTRFEGLTAYCGQADGLTESVGAQFGIEQPASTCDDGVGRVSWIRRERVLLGSVADERRGLGGWPVDVVHTYDPTSHYLYYGNGRRRSVQSTGMVARPRAALAAPGIGMGPYDVGGMSFDALGDLYVTLLNRTTGSESLNESWEGLYRLRPGANELELLSNLPDATDVAVARDGSIWVAGGWEGCVRRYEPSEAVPWSGTSVIGACEPYGSGTTEPRGSVPEFGVLDAALVQVARIFELGPLADGSMSFTASTSFDDVPFLRWRPTASGGVVDFRSTTSPFMAPVQLVASPEGGLLVDGVFENLPSGDRLVQRLDANASLLPSVGRLDAAIGQVDYLPSTDVRLEYLPAYPAYLTHRGLAADQRGAVYVAQGRVRDGGAVDNSVGRILRSHAGYTQTIAGPPSSDEAADNVTNDLCRVASSDPAAAIPARSVTFRFLRDLAARPDGTLMAAVQCEMGPWAGQLVLFEISSPFEGSLEAPHTIAAEDRSEVYEFDDVGRHLRTRDPISGHTLWSFTYDSVGRLHTMRDRENQVTTIAYSEGAVTVTAPGNLVTTLTLDANGYATTIAGPNAAGGTLDRQVWTATYDTNTETQLGLLRAITLPGDMAAHTFTYEPDGSGRLRTDSSLADVSGGVPPTQSLSEDVGAIFSELQGVPLDAVRQVTLTSAMGRERRFAMHRQGGQLWTRAEMPSGAFTERLDLGLSLGRAEQLHYDGSHSSTETTRDPVYDLDAAYVSRAAYCRPTALLGQPSSCFDVGPESRLEVSRQRSLISANVLDDIITVAGDTWRTRYFMGSRNIALQAPNLRTVDISYDAQGRVRRIQRPDQYPICVSYTGHRISAIRQGNYDASCAGTPSTRRVVSFDWDTSGRRWLEGVSSGYGASAMSTDFVPDPNRGLPTSVLLPGRTSQTTLRYDAQNRLTLLLPAGHAPVDDYVYRYTPRGFFFSETTPRSDQVDGTVFADPLCQRSCRLLITRDVA